MEVPDWIEDEGIRRKLNGIFHAPFAELLGMETVSMTPDGEARVRMDIKGMENAIGNAHGGAVFALADQALAISANMGDSSQVAMTCSISYIRPVRGVVEAVAKKVAETNSTAVYDVKVVQGEEVLASFQATTYKIKKKIDW
ncbi:MAG: Thioesterase superfamily protein [Methanomassiliicoccales archaeon PtaU1.Bin124]|nr:MAG: Thioesterase superfamily protein [Methanomassiliicoccales archaeon PtaU1.Bin124]